MLDFSPVLLRCRFSLTVCIAIILATLFSTLYNSQVFSSHKWSNHKGYVTHSAEVSIAEHRRSAHLSLEKWLQHLENISPMIYTRRIGCREFPDAAQTCVFEGVICIDTSAKVPFGRPIVYLVDDERENGTEVPSDRWCSYRHQSSDPRYWGGRHWPIWTHTVAPRWSCMKAFYRTTKSLDLSNGAGIKWVESLWLVDLDYVRNDHNNHLFMDIVWILDAMLWQKSLSLTHNDTEMNLFGGGPHKLYLPQGRNDFEIQTGRDLNRLLYALVLQLNLSKLYPVNRETQQVRCTKPLFEAFPELNRRLLFHRELHNDSNVDLVCTPRLTSGAKLSTGGHERVCRSIRQRTWKLYGISELPMVRVGQAYYPQPPKRIVIVQRHKSRKIRNVGELEKALREAFPQKHGFEVEVISTGMISTAEQWARVYSHAGVLISSHGSQNMGLMFMPRHSALVEVMPVGYVDNAFGILSRNCRILYYQLQSRLNPDFRKEHFEKNCGGKEPHLLNPCNEVKNIDVEVDITLSIKTVGIALERIGYVTKAWMEFVNDQ